MGYGGGYFGGGYSGGGYSVGGGYGYGGAGYAPGVSSTDLQQAGFQVAADDQSATDGGLTLQNADGTGNLSNIPGVSTNASDAVGAFIFANPVPGTSVTTTEANPFGGTDTTDVAAGPGSTVTQLGNGSFQVTDGAIGIRTTDEAGNISSVNEILTGNAFAIVSQPQPGGPISVKIGATGN